jgi:ketosteroid isomerase-like protein
MDGAQIIEVVDRFWRALEDGDYLSAHALVTPDATIWHCHDDDGRPAKVVLDEEAARDAQLPPEVLANRKRYRLLRRYVVGDDCLQQQVAEVKTPGGRFEIPMFVRHELVDGRIRVIEEYWDSCAVAALAAAGDVLAPALR